LIVADVLDLNSHAIWVRRVIGGPIRHHTEADAVGTSQQPLDEDKLNKGEWLDSFSEWKASRPGHGPSNHFDVFIHEAGGPLAR
jgi:hypothetical protein